MAHKPKRTLTLKPTAPFHESSYPRREIVRQAAGFVEVPPRKGWYPAAICVPDPKTAIVGFAPLTQGPVDPPDYVMGTTATGWTQLPPVRDNVPIWVYVQGGFTHVRWTPPAAIVLYD